MAAEYASLDERLLAEASFGEGLAPPLTESSFIGEAQPQTAFSGAGGAGSPGKPGKHHFVTKYMLHLFKWRWLYITLYILLVGFSAWQGPPLLSNTTENFVAAPGTRAAIQNALAQTHMPAITTSNSMALFLSSTTNSSVLTPAVEALSYKLNATAMAYSKPGYVKSVSGYYIALKDKLPMQLAEPFVSDDGTSTFLLVNYHDNVATNEAKALAAYLVANLDRLHAEMGPEAASISASVLGIAAFLKPLTDALEYDMTMMDGCVLPVALFVLWTMLRTWRLMILPMLTIITSALISFCVVNVTMAAHHPVFTLAPTLMTSLILALSIDYSLFMLVRYRLELVRFGDHYVAVSMMMRYAGHTILVSSCTLVIVFFGMILFDVPTIEDIGYGCGVSIAVTMTVNQTLLPIVLMMAPEFFKKSTNSAFFDRMVATLCGCCRCCQRHQEEPENEEASLITKTPKSDSAQYGSSSEVPQRAAAAGVSRSDHVRAMKRSLWYRFGQWLVKWPGNVTVLVLVIAVTCPFWFHAFNFTTVDNVEIDMPRGEAVTVELAEFLQKFGYGSFMPFYFVVTPPAHAPGYDPALPPILQTDVLNNITSWLSTLPSKVPLTAAHDFTSVMYAQGEAFPVSLLQQCYLGTAPPIFDSLCAGVHYGLRTTCNGDISTASILFQEHFSPGSRVAAGWLSDMWGQVDSFQAATGYSVQLIGFGQDSLDTVAAVFAKFPTMIAITCGSMFFFVGLAFKSVLVPLRSMVTTGLTLLFVFGAATLVYEHGILNWTHMPGLKQEPSIMYMVPLLAFTIVVGTSLDYDIFILTHIFEQRAKGHSPREAIVRGLHGTGFVITAAGVIMALAFVALVLSSEGSTNEMGFYLVVAILFDTFIVRSLLVPSIMSFLGEWSWFPANRMGNNKRSAALPREPSLTYPSNA